MSTNVTTIGGREAGTLRSCAQHPTNFPDETRLREKSEFGFYSLSKDKLQPNCKRCDKIHRDARATGAHAIAKKLYPKIYDKYVAVRSPGGQRFSPKVWLSVGGTQDEVNKILAQSGVVRTQPKKMFGVRVISGTKFGSRPGIRGARQSGHNPTAKGRENELTMNEILLANNPDCFIIDVATWQAQLGYDTQLWRKGDPKMAAAFDSSADKKLEDNEYEAMKRLHEQGIPYFIFHHGTKGGGLLPITPDTPWKIGSRRF